jgi:hypothetical protein
VPIALCYNRTDPFVAQAVERAITRGRSAMPAIDYSHLSPAERLDLIGEIWDSIDTR